MSRWASGLTAAVVASSSYAALARRPPGGRGRWERTNHRGRSVTLLAGPAVAMGAVAGASLTGAAPVLLAGGGAATCGLIDDLTGATHARGFRGHVSALRRGQVTTGLMKLAGIGASALAASVVQRRMRAATVADTLVDAALIAGSANLVNLLDLRPGRALKATAASAGALAVAGGSPVASAALMSALVVLPVDLREQAMIGDCGANALGALVGLAATTRPRASRLTALAVVVGLTAASERVSFSEVIARTPLLAALDRLGRLPA